MRDDRYRNPPTVAAAMWIIMAAVAWLVVVAIWLIARS